ncbi:MAG: peptidoglycan-binding protein [Ruminococcus sp.]|nr:peptidoglycan-binding protein [Ruminococcus sp.]
MPYTDEQKKSHITELQRYLHGIEISRGDIPSVIPDGIYGSETAEAVRRFQKENKLPETGKTDADTWDGIVKEYLRLMGAEPRKLPVFPSADYICRVGCNGVTVRLIQSLLLELSRKYDNLETVTVNGEYNDETAAAVMKLQKICGLEANGAVDVKTWNLIVVCSEDFN